MYIGELAKRAGASRKAIRLYESMGLLGPVKRKGAYRVYCEDDVRKVQMIREAQTLGFKLAEVKPVLEADNGAPDWERILQQLVLKRTQIRAQLKHLQAFDAQLAEIERNVRTCVLKQSDETVAAALALAQSS